MLEDKKTEVGRKKKKNVDRDTKGVLHIKFLTIYSDYKQICTEKRGRGRNA